MAQFFIALPGNRKGNVRSGIQKKKKKSFLALLLPWKKAEKEEKLAYIVSVEPGHDINEYHLLKTKEGRWLQEGEDKWLREGDGAFNLAIKKAIDDYEHQKRNGSI